MIKNSNIKKITFTVHIIRIKIKKSKDPIEINNERIFQELNYTEKYKRINFKVRENQRIYFKKHINFASCPILNYFKN